MLLRYWISNIPQDSEFGNSSRWSFLSLKGVWLEFMGMEYLLVENIKIVEAST